MRPRSRALLAKARLPALLVSNLTNIRYLTGMNLSSGLVLVLPRAYVLFTDSRYTEAAAEGVCEDVDVRSTDDLRMMMKKIPLCGYEEEQVTVARLRRWKKAWPETKLVRSDEVVEEYRRSKDDAELKHIRRAEKITRELLRRIPSALKTGITEIGLAWTIEQWARELGAERMSFESIVGFGAHTSRPHHHPTTKKLTKNMIVQIDIGVVVHGYCSDRSAVFFTGPIPKDQERAYKAVLEAKEAAKKICKAGVTAKAIDEAARKVLRSYSIEEYFTHSLGHGVGLDIHEGVSLSPRSKERLLKNEVITIEPGVYFPGKFGIRLEDMVVVA
ncbi:aminopeptidase P family protein [Candidatus Peribacteria bacterium]|nr:MAG: aminopeptidase P family protein [Candidatus Peribacteria bacterium]